MSERNPRVSIGLPVYNGESFIRIAVDSILSQTFNDFELIISDNGSTDRTGEICSEYADRDSRVSYIRNKTNLGAAENYNQVFRMSTGQYFRWATADDVFAPESLEKCVPVLEKNPDVILCYPKTILIDGDGKVIGPYEDNLDLRSSSVIDRFSRALQQIGLVNILYGLIRSDLLKETSLIGNYPGSDVVFLVELTLYGKFFEIPDRLFFRRMHAGAQSSIKTVEGVQEFFDPKSKGKIYLRSWKHGWQELLSIFRSFRTVYEKVQLSYILFRSSVASRGKFLDDFKSTISQIWSRWTT